MRQQLAILVVLVFTFSLASAQDKVAPNRPYVSLSAKSGYITINEFSAGTGLKVTDVPYSKSFFGINTIHGYQINESFVVGGGTGVLFYNEGSLIPLFADVRYRFLINKFTPYLFGDGGMLFGGGETRLFVNGGGGVRYTINDRLGIHFGTGLWIQNGTTRDSFISFKLGVVFKPR